MIVSLMWKRKKLNNIKKQKRVHVIKRSHLDVIVLLKPKG